MKNAQVLKVYDLIQKLKKTDELIKLHHSLSDEPFLVEQYIARRDKLFAKLITQLASPTLASPVSYQLVQQLIARFNKPVYQSTTINDEELLELQQLALA